MKIPDNCRKCPVWKRSLFRDFDENLVSWVAEKKKPVNLQKKEILFKQGQNADGIYCHLSGLAKVVQKDDAGNVRFSRLVLPGDTSGHRSIFIENRYKGTTEVISDSLQACYIPKTDILHLLSSNVSFAKSLVIKISSELERTVEEQISAREKSVRDRLAQILCELHEVHAEPVNEGQWMIKSEIPKVDIASFLSVANETVIRQMSDMKSEGLIAYEGKKIVIKNIEKLKAISRTR